MIDRPEATGYLTDGLPKRYAKARVPIEEGERIERAHSPMFRPAVILTNKRMVVVRPRGRNPEVTSVDFAQMRDIDTSVEMPVWNWVMAGVLTLMYGTGIFLFAWYLITRRLRVTYETAARLDAKLLLEVPKPASWVDAIHELRRQ